MRTLFLCLECGHRLLERNPDTRHRCHDCHSAAFVKQVDLRLAGLALKPVATLWLMRGERRLLPPPVPWEVVDLPSYTAALFSVISKARTPERGRRAVEFMLIEVGFPESQARDFAAQVYST